MAFDPKHIITMEMSIAGPDIDAACEAVAALVDAVDSIGIAQEDLHIVDGPRESSIEAFLVFDSRTVDASMRPKLQRLFLTLTSIVLQQFEITEQEYTASVNWA